MTLGGSGAVLYDGSHAAPDILLSLDSVPSSDTHQIRADPRWRPERTRSESPIRINGGKIHKLCSGRGGVSARYSSVPALSWCHTSSGTRDFLCTAILSVCLMSSALLPRLAMTGATDSRVAVGSRIQQNSSRDGEDLSPSPACLPRHALTRSPYHHGMSPARSSWLEDLMGGVMVRAPAPVYCCYHGDMKSGGGSVNPPTNHLKGKRPREDLTDADSHPRNGAMKRSSKRVRKNVDQQSADSAVPDQIQDQIQDSPAAHSRNLRERKVYYCQHCEKTFNYTSALEAHLRVHSGDKPHKCIDCNKSFGYKSELIVHRRKHSKSSKNVPNGVQDEPPTKAVPQESSMNGTSGPGNTSAENAPSPISQTSPETPNSQASTSSGGTPSSFSGSLPQHESEKPLKCNFCEKRFNDKSILEAHHRIHTGKLAYPCSLCDMSFSKPSLLAAHNNTHREGKPFQCDQCDKNFNDQSLLVAHKRTHTGEKPHKCSHCNKWFPNRNSLVEHEECHLKPKPFKCRHCEKSFNDKALLVTHEGVHTDTKPFKCTQCSESFFLKTQLMAHQSNHAPDKPFPCHQCERSFNKKETLLAHIRVHNMQCVQVQKKKNP
ncbi:PREDICTED: zinc finger protein 2-like [Nanorana parkeri]|uniref:zinc finger protein 2-like n=1 Tax=Nanorana parkeri TaxID=125878 RepID=UPI0008542BE3|nr:PREDICTED: zinc finger protein 2-like [Nanorana parkeri]